MRKKITIEDALWRGTLMLILLPILFLNLAVWPVFVYSCKMMIPEWSIGIALLGGFTGSWLIWSLLVTKWKLWAFSKVDNVKELKKRAVAGKLIWKDSSLFTRTEIRSSVQKQQLLEIEKRLAKQ